MSRECKKRWYKAYYKDELIAVSDTKATLNDYMMNNRGMKQPQYTIRT